MIKRLLIASLLTALALGGLAAGCLQKEGKPCQTTTDCDKDLVCCFEGAAADQTLGVCQVGDTCTRIDAGVDASIDASP